MDTNTLANPTVKAAIEALQKRRPQGVVGAFHCDQWGDFWTYFRFRLSPSDKVKRLDIGLAD